LGRRYDWPGRRRTGKGTGRSARSITGTGWGKGGAGVIDKRVILKLKKKRFLKPNSENFIPGKEFLN